jgi:hypothetical protein
MKPKVLGYWSSTILLAFALLSGGAAEIVRQRGTIEGMVHLGYPGYFVMIIGFWKVLGAITLLAPGLLLLKEWAYAGVFFNMTGAAVSHAVCGDPGWHVIVTLSFRSPCGRVVGIASINSPPRPRHLLRPKQERHHALRKQI